MGALAARVFLADDSGEVHDFAAGTDEGDLPSWAKKTLQGNDRAFVDEYGTPTGAYDATAHAEGEGEGEGGEGSYEDRTVADLKAEIAKRNEAREDDDKIEVAEPGNKPELIAALTADDDA